MMTFTSAGEFGFFSPRRFQRHRQTRRGRIIQNKRYECLHCLEGHTRARVSYAAPWHPQDRVEAPHCCSFLYRLESRSILLKFGSHTHIHIKTVYTTFKVLLSVYLVFPKRRKLFSTFLRFVFWIYNFLRTHILSKSHSYTGLLFDCIEHDGGKCLTDTCVTCQVSHGWWCQPSHSLV